ncbi:MAG: prepilin-type N-terminal cleavage/methylation domain-containing protein [Gemmatimonadota bacterium]|nr:prepilin-type N-terminal cleavage/methylation domain-containing protein [Gemmatimonadota bacterium]
MALHPYENSLQRPRRAFTLAEMLVSLTITGVVMAIATTMLRVQANSMAEHAGRNDALASARYALNTMDREIRVAGQAVVPSQPIVVQAQSDAITFNAAIVTRDSSDAAYVYFNPSVDTLASTLLTVERQITLPNSSFRYPSVSYNADGGAPGRAETISFWVSPDTLEGRVDEYVLWRRINDEAPQVIVRHVLIASLSDEPVFRYYKIDPTTGVQSEIPQSALPLYHSATAHNSLSDTAASAMTDSIRFVRVHVRSLYHDPQRGDLQSLVDGSVRLLNAGLVNRQTCGDPPIGTTLTASYVALPTPHVHLTWPASLDQEAGEKDVERYAIYKRRAATSVFREPAFSVGAQSATYTHDDYAISSGDRWIYGLIAEDCTPASSPMSITGTVQIP